MPYPAYTFRAAKQKERRSCVLPIRLPRYLTKHLLHFPQKRDKRRKITYLFNCPHIAEKGRLVSLQSII